MADAELVLFSTGAIAKQAGLSVSAIKRAVQEGRAPGVITVIGSGKKVWRAEDVPVVLEALQQGSQRKVRVA